MLLLLLSCCRVQLFVTPWTAAHQVPCPSLSPVSWSLLKLMSIELMTPSNHLTLCRLLLFLSSVFPSIRVFSNELALQVRCQSIGGSASASVLPLNIQGWFPIGFTGLISLLSKGLSRVFSSTTTILCRWWNAVFSSVFSGVSSPEQLMFTKCLWWCWLFYQSVWKDIAIYHRPSASDNWNLSSHSYGH